MKSPLMVFCLVLLFFSWLGLGQPCLAQTPDPASSLEEDDLNLGGDIFTDFNEELDAAHIVEEERFYRYGRFFAFNLGLGLTSFDGHRGKAYENTPPSYGASFTFFSDFQKAYSLGVEFSKHNFYVDQIVNKYASAPPGLIQVSMLRVFLAFRYYLDTSNLGTALTYSNPYFVTRAEYWYTTNKFVDQPSFEKDSGGGLGLGIGGGLEFPIKLKENYVNIEFLFHAVNFHDKYTQDYRPLSSNNYGYDDLTGNTYSVMAYYSMNW